MSIGKPLLIGLTGITGLGIPATAGAYNLTKETIGDRLSEYIIPDSYDTNNDESINSAWNTLRSKLKDKNIDDPYLNSIKSNEQADSDHSLRSWCFTAYRKIYKGWFQEANTKLEKNVKDACTHTIRDQLGSNKIEFNNDSSNSQESTFKEKAKKLKDHQVTLAILEPALLEIKDSDNPENKWEKLRDWCKEAYDKGYQGEKSNRWKLINLYCKKDSGNS